MHYLPCTSEYPTGLLTLDPRFITKRRNHFKMQELESVNIDRNPLMLYPPLRAEASDVEKTHTFKVARAAFTTKRRSAIEEGLIVAAAR